VGPEGGGVVVGGLVIFQALVSKSKDT
jgi:hypothetical protein